MNTSALKTFAPAVRQQLMEAVTPISNPVTLAAPEIHVSLVQTKKNSPV
jgi:hypothetical protein